MNIFHAYTTECFKNIRIRLKHYNERKSCITREITLFLDFKEKPQNNLIILSTYCTTQYLKLQLFGLLANHMVEKKVKVRDFVILFTLHLTKFKRKSKRNIFPLLQLQHNSPISQSQQFK